MKNNREYIINFGNLKPGKYEYSFEIGKTFFEEYEYSLVKDASTEVQLLLDKESETLLILDFSYKGTIEVACDRCLDDFSLPMENKRRIIVKLTGKETESEDDDLIYLAPDAWHLDVRPMLYEFINLELPLRLVCELAGKECNDSMVNVLKKQEEKKKDADTDPRWEGLKNLKNKDEE